VLAERSGRGNSWKRPWSCEGSDRLRDDQLVRNALGLELALDPGGQAHGPDALDVARTGTVGETVEDVENLPVGIEGGEGQREPAANDQPDGRVGDDRPGAPRS